VATYATVDDVVAEYDGTIAGDQIEYIDRKLTSAELVLGAVSGDLAGRIASGRTSAELVRLVLCNMVIRILRNTGGVKTQTVGPFSYTLDAQVASGRLFVSREDRRLLGLRSGASTLVLDDPALPRVLQKPTDFDEWVEQSTAPGVLPAPGSVTVGAVTSSSVALSWPGVANAVAYQVQSRLSVGSDEWSPVTSVNGGTPTISVTTVTGLASATSYQFRVHAVNIDGQASNPSPVVTAVTAA
jgi:hypothetical protein